MSLAIFAAACLPASPISGYMADRYQNRRIPMTLGLLTILGATIFFCFSTNIAMLVIARLFQGVSTAVIWTVGLALVIDTVDRKNIGQATGWTTVAQSIGVFSGPILGGIVYHNSGYYAVWAMCFAIVAVAIVLRVFIIEKKETKKWLPDSLTSTDTEATVVSQASNKPATRSQETAVLSRAPSDIEEGLPEKKGSPPKQKAFGHEFLGLIRKPRLLAALWGTLVEASIQTSFESTLPLFVHETFHWDSTGAGLIFLPIVIPTFLAPVVGKLGDRYGPKWLCAGGFAFTVPFFVCLRFVTDNSINHKVMLIAFLAGIGLGLTFVFAPLMAEISWAVESDHQEEDGIPPYAQAYGLYNLAYSGGAIAGPLMGGLIRDSAGFATVGWTFAIMSGFTAITQALWIGDNSLKTWRRKNSTSHQSTNSEATVVAA
ncbi:hypothetical protein Golomagni_05589 [Golovinomyces magnicellulatus]|nr:hypothetical protein Golomagni_05589 [Golovinomyces magnicellulatus]